MVTTTAPLRPPAESRSPARAYFLSEVSLEIPRADTAIFRAKLNGPSGAQVWARAWLGSEADGTLAESASPSLRAGESVTLTVVLRDRRVSENAFMRIESAPLVTEHVVGIRLPQSRDT